MAIEATEILCQITLPLFSKEAELLESSNLFRQAAFVQAKAGKLEKAVATLERGRARNLSEILKSDRAVLSDIASLHPEVYWQYRKAAETLSQIEVNERYGDMLQSSSQPRISNFELRQQAKAMRKEMHEAISVIQKYLATSIFSIYQISVT